MPPALVGLAAAAAACSQARFYVRTHAQLYTTSGVTCHVYLASMQVQGTLWHCIWTMCVV
jgi:hypothetical protein